MVTYDYETGKELKDLPVEKDEEELKGRMKSFLKRAKKEASGDVHPSFRETEYRPEERPRKSLRRQLSKEELSPTKFKKGGYPKTEDVSREGVKFKRGLTQLGRDTGYVAKERAKYAKYVAGKRLTPPKSRASYSGFRKGALGLFTLMTGQRTPGGSAYNPYATKRSSKSKRRRGRPSGPSGRYRIDGYPVTVQQYRRWKSRQRAIQRISPLPTYQDAGQPTQQAEFYEERTPPLMAKPKPPIGSILNAPNIFKGELRNVRDQGITESDFLNTDNVDRPVVNPHGEYFTDVDPLTGRSILRRRPQERWLSGRKRQ